jgi:hypothetical protein
MKTIAEIEAALPGLTIEELLQVQGAIRRQLLHLGESIVYHDAYGTTTQRELIASADEAFQAYDKAESEAAKDRKR